MATLSMTLTATAHPAAEIMLPLRHIFGGNTKVPVRHHLKHVLSTQKAACIRHSSASDVSCFWLHAPCAPFNKITNRSLVKAAASSGLEASITDPKDNVIKMKNVTIVQESQDIDKIRVRVDLTGDETEIVFGKVLTNLARTAPPVPGFRRQKGGKTSKVPKEFLLKMLGEERVTNFVIQEIISSTLADYAKKENLNVKDNKVNTIQTAEELRSLFSPGNAFGFNATLELQKETAET